MHRYQPRLCVVPVGPEPDVHVFSFPQTAFYAVTSYQNPLMTRLKIDCNPFMLAFREDGPSARLIQSRLKLCVTPDLHRHRSSWTHTPREVSEEGRQRDETPVGGGAVCSSAAGCDALRSSPEPLRCGVRRGGKRVFRRGWRSGAKKARAKWWTKVKQRSAAVSRSSDTACMQPDLEQVDGLLFVSFTAKEALEVHVRNMRRSEAPGAENPAPDAGWICEQELVLLKQLQQMKNRQIIHPVLQQVGMKLNLLDPTAPIDLHYLGVALPLPSPVLTSSSSHAGLVSRSGKTSDVTRIKGWVEKTHSESTADSSGHSAFSSVLLDEYLEAEGQRISERASVLSSSAPVSPVLYQLPVKSSSYVRTLASVLQTRSRRGAGPAPDASGRCSSARLRWKRSVSSDVPQQRPAASRRGRRRRRRTLRFNRDAVDGAQPSASAQKRSELLELEEQAVSLGHEPSHISPERASYALSSLLTAEKAARTPRLRDGVCVRDFCRLGCVCESLERGAAGSSHCRRVQCMFSCSCFRHKIILLRSENRPSSLVAFPVAGPGADSRPEPAPRIRSLWQRRHGEKDPEPLFTPRASGPSRRVPRHHTPGPRPRLQVRETEKDPVYLYLESMMTCARVREYNSNPPPQVHLLPAKRSTPAPDDTVRGVSQPGLAASQNPGESGEAEPTKVLEIISGCNWETHRSLVLKELFRRVSTDLLAPLFYIDIYKVQLLSKELRKDKSGSTLIYKVCVSLGPTPEKTRELKQSVKKREEASRLRSSSSQKVTKPSVNENPQISPTLTADEKHPELFPLLSRVVPAGRLRAEKKTLVRSGPIKVNGKTYAQAKLILGRMGALHPANRLAAYVTGRIKPLPQNTSRALSKTLQGRTLTETRGPSKHTVSQANQRKAVFKMPITRSPAMPWGPYGIRHTPSLSVPNPGALNPTSSRSRGRGSSAVAPPLSAAETVLPASALPPGQQVVLQPVAGMTGVNMCQFNGQMIQLVPVTAAVPVQVQPGAGASGGAQPDSAQMTTASQKPSSKPLPLIVPRIPGVQGNSGFAFGSVAAPGLQNGMLGKAGMFSFRICPPSAESKTAALEQTGSAPESTGTASTLLLPGGYRLIKLPMFVSPASVCSEKSPESSETTRENPAREDPDTLAVKTEPAEDGAPVIIKVESHSDESSSQHPSRSGSEPEIKMENQDSSHRVKTEEPVSAVSHPPNTSEETGHTASLSQSSPAPSQTKPPGPGPEEVQNRRKRQAPDAPGADPAEVRQSSSAAMYSSDGWTTEDSDEWYEEEDVDIETFEEFDEKMNISLLRAKARRKTQQAAQRQWLLNCESLTSQHAVRLMSDLLLYKRTWRLNQTLRERKQHAEIQQRLVSLKRTLGVEDVVMSTPDLLREARQMITALQEHDTALMAKKRALIRQHSHYQTLISQRSRTHVTGTELQQKTASLALPRSLSETSAHPQSVMKRRLPDVILQSFSKK